MGPDNQTPQHVHQAAGSWIDLAPSHNTQLSREHVFDFEAALQLPELPTWLLDSQVGETPLAQDHGTAQQ
jgi:hypothetical protein